MTGNHANLRYADKILPETVKLFTLGMRSVIEQNLCYSMPDYK